ncbi:MAG: metallophosphoesterase family protein [Bacteroidales bacterium]|jgi:predicted phosphodiesterase|nr:metallophosphoesterase family protein [Bacteroidales bacterium]
MKINFAFLFWLLPVWGFAQQVKITHGPYLQALGENEVTIVWTTDNPAVSWVELAPAGDDSFYAQERPQYCQTRHGNRVVGQLHQVTIQGLERGTEYRYRIFSQAVFDQSGTLSCGRVASSNVYSKKPLRFTTSDSQKTDLSFVALNDIHGRQDDLRALCGNVKYGKTDLVIFNGDMVDRMDGEQQFFDAFMDEAVKLFAGEVPVFYARGNHETRGTFHPYFADYFPSRNGQLYYSFRHGPVHFIVLDSGEDKPDSDVEYFGLARFDAYRSQQQEWLKKEIESESFRSASYRMVIVHIPPTGSDWHGAAEVKNKFLPLLRHAGITVMFCGHTHKYQYIAPDDQLHDFPILINAPNTALEVSATPNALSVKRKDTAGKELNVFTYKH